MGKKMPAFHIQSGYYSDSFLFRVYMCETICEMDYTIKYMLIAEPETQLMLNKWQLLIMEMVIL